MAFLDNSGDIILDAVLTDTGRQRLAKGDGSFRITRFALGDDEINYGLYDRNHPSGSAYYDIEIMQTPVFEAFTNNVASLNSRLMSISRTNLEYLPILAINNFETPYANQKVVQNGYILAVDEDTQTFLSDISKQDVLYDGLDMILDGVLFGVGTNSKHIRVDQGIDNKNYPIDQGLDSDLTEIQYLIEVDNRFARLVGPGLEEIQVSYIDDDDMAAYYVANQDSTSTVSKNDSKSGDSGEIIKGARGTILKFKLKSQLDVSTSEHLFDKLGTEVTSKFVLPESSPYASNKVKIISTSVRITGLTTGYAIDVPLVLMKLI